MVLKKTDCFDSVAVSDLLGGLVRLLAQDSILGDGDSGDVHFGDGVSMNTAGELCFMQIINIGLKSDGPEK